MSSIQKDQNDAIDSSHYGKQTPTGRPNGVSEKSITFKEESKNEINRGTMKTRSRPSCCLFVASLAASLTDDQLWVSVVDYFKQFGEVVMAKVLRDHKKRPYAFVQYKTEQEANNALLKASNSILNGRNIRCEKARVNRTLLISENFPIPNSDNILYSNLTEVGEIEKMVSVQQFHKHKNPSHESNIHHNTIPPPCNAWFVQFAYRDDAISVHALLKNEGRYRAEWVENLTVPDELNLISKLEKTLKDTGNNSFKDTEHHHFQEFSGQAALRQEGYNDNISNSGNFVGDKNNNNSSSNMNSNIDPSSNNGINKKHEIDMFSIFVGQLPNDCTEDEVKRKFEVYGEIENINFFSKQGNCSFAFIKYASTKSASSAIESENHSYFKSKTIHVQFRERYHISAEKKRYYNYMNERNMRSKHLDPNTIDNHSKNTFQRRNFNHYGNNSYVPYLKNNMFPPVPDHVHPAGMFPPPNTYVPYIPKPEGSFNSEFVEQEKHNYQEKDDNTVVSSEDFAMRTSKAATDTEASTMDYQSNSIRAKQQQNQSSSQNQNYPVFVNPYYYNPNMMYYPNQYYPQKFEDPKNFQQMEQIANPAQPLAYNRNNNSETESTRMGPRIPLERVQGSENVYFPHNNQAPPGFPAQPPLQLNMPPNKNHQSNTTHNNQIPIHHQQTPHMMNDVYHGNSKHNFSHGNSRNEAPKLSTYIPNQHGNTNFGFSGNTDPNLEPSRKFQPTTDLSY